MLTSQNDLANGESALNSAYINYQEAYIDYQRATQTLLTSYGMILKTP